MLHMVIMTHGPETCPASHPEIREKCGTRLMQLKEGSAKHGVTIQGFWANPPEHVFYVVADAPNAHAINDLTSELELFHWNTIEVRPVVVFG